MRNLLFYLALVILIMGCQKDSPILDSEDSMDNPEIPTSDISSYDPNEVPEKEAAKENLLANGSFEENDDLWTLCGSASIISSSEAQEGSKYLEITTQGECELDTRTFGNLYGNAYYPLNVDSLPNEIHVSFYVKSSIPLSLLENPLGIYLLGNTDLYEGYDGRSVKFLNTHGDIIGTDWTLIKLALDKNEMQTYLGELAPKWIYFDIASTFSELADITISIDRIKVTYEKEVTQPEPMPSSLLNYIGNDKILFVNSDKQVAATMKPNGGNLINYDNLSTEIISSVPYWYDDEQITIGKKVFKPLPNNDVQIIANSQTELYRYDLVTENETLLFETLGNPGRHEFDGSANNLDALDLEVKRVDWDPIRKRGALTVCANNRNLSYVSDDYCLIYIIDEEGNVLSSDTEGFNAAWSPSGQLAYVLHGSIYIADVSSDGSVNASVIYESNSDLFDVVDWSPDGNSLVFMERGGDIVGSVYAQAIKTLNLATEKIKELVLVDHGEAYPNVSWSKNGDFMIYSLFIPNKSNPSVGRIQIWWLEVATGKTGPITNTINAYGGTFLNL